VIVKMKRIMSMMIVASMMLAVVMAAQVGTRIKDGVLEYSAGHYLEGTPLVLGYDPFGYNYQGHMFRGSYANAYLGRSGNGYPPWEGDDEAYYQRLIAEEYVNTPEEAEALMNTVSVWAYREVTLIMKWNDAWLSNMDRDVDGSLDRHYGFGSYDGSGAWLTNYQAGTYDDEGETYAWNYYVKIVTPSTVAGDWMDVGDPGPEDDRWRSADDTEIGPPIWGAFAVIQRVYNDQGTGEHGIEYLSPSPAGFGYYDEDDL
jgi:hypothetical protein